MITYRLIHKDAKNQPAGAYTDPGWKEQIAQECYYQCVYCSIHENHWGGIDHYHIDHFRPKSIAAFASLENSILNLFYACPVCNRFKSNDWPADPDLNAISYPDPSITDYSTIFDFDNNHFTLLGKYVSANYLIHRLYLNRPQLIYERRETFLKQRALELIKEVHDLATKIQDNELIKKTFSLVVNIMAHLAARENIRPYKLAEIRKP